MAFQSKIPRYKTAVAEVDFSGLPEMAPYREEPKAMYVGAPGKHGYLRLDFEIDQWGKSILRTIDRRAPLIVQQALYFDEEMPGMPCVYILASGGPYVDGDRFEQIFDLKEGAYAHISTGAATKMSQMRSNYAGMRQKFVLEKYAYLEYLPEPMYPALHTRFVCDTDITIDPTATLVYSEIYMCGRKYYKRFCPDGEIYVYDVISVCTHASHPGGDELFREKFVIEPYRRFPKVIGVMDDYDVFANVVVLTPPATARKIYEQTEPYIDRDNKIAVGITTLPNDAGLLFKVMGDKPVPVKGIVRKFASTVRMAVKGKPIPKEFPWRL